jgi:hypothetical protein
MTIHWKALEEHFLMVTLVSLFNHFPEKNAFSEFFSKKLSLESYIMNSKLIIKDTGQYLVH